MYLNVDLCTQMMCGCFLLIHMIPQYCVLLNSLSRWWTLTCMEMKAIWSFRSHVTLCVLSLYCEIVGKPPSSYLCSLQTYQRMRCPQCSHVSLEKATKLSAVGCGCKMTSLNQMRPQKVGAWVFIDHLTIFHSVISFVTFIYFLILNAYFYSYILFISIEVSLNKKYMI